MCEPRQLDESYVTSAQHCILDKAAPPERLSSATWPDDLEVSQASQTSPPRISARGACCRSDRAPFKGATGTSEKKARERGSPPSLQKPLRLMLELMNLQADVLNANLLTSPSQRDMDGTQF